MKDLKEKIVEVYQPKINNQTKLYFTQLITYIDNAIGESFSEDDNKKSEALIKHLMNIRNFMSTNVLENNLRISLINEVFQIMDELESENIQKHMPTDEKKELESKDQKAQEENILDKDQLTP